MYTSRDRVGLLAAILVVIGLVWFGLGHFGSAGSTPPAQTTTTTPGATRKVVVDYLQTLQRIDAPAERLEQKVGKKALAKLAKPGPASSATLRLVARMGAGYVRAAAAVSAVHPPAGFENAQRLLVRVYTDQTKVYRAMSQMSGQTNPNQLMGVLTRLDNALGAFNTDLPNCRSAFQSATAAAGLKTPAWVAALIGHATGGPT
jgi:hypothetical protein